MCISTPIVDHFVVVDHANQDRRSPITLTFYELDGIVTRLRCHGRFSSFNSLNFHLHALRGIQRVLEVMRGNSTICS